MAMVIINKQYLSSCVLHNSYYRKVFHTGLQQQGRQLVHHVVWGSARKNTDGFCINISQVAIRTLTELRVPVLI